MAVFQFRVQNLYNDLSEGREAVEEEENEDQEDNDMAFDEDVDRMQINSMINCLFITKGKLDVCRKSLI